MKTKSDCVLAQCAIEERYNRKHIDIKLKDFIKYDSFMKSKIEEGMLLVTDYINKDYYESKMSRVNQLKLLDINQLVIDIYVGIAYFQLPELMTSVIPQIASRLHMSDKLDAIKTVAELLAVLCETDVFDITKESKQSSLMIVSNILLPVELLNFVEDTAILPPMVCKPMKLVGNYDSGYLTHKDSLLLGHGNHHDGDLCLDVLNIMNSVGLSISEQFIYSINEIPSFDLDTPEKKRNWDTFISKSKYFYKLMINEGNKFHLTHKVDTRGRIYASGYYISTIGAPYKKAMLEFSKKEIVTGVP